MAATKAASRSGGITKRATRQGRRQFFERVSHGFPGDRLDDPQFDDPASEQPQRPAGIARWWRGAGDRSDLQLLGGGEHPGHRRGRARRAGQAGQTRTAAQAARVRATVRVETPTCAATAASVNAGPAVLESAASRIRARCSDQALRWPVRTICWRWWRSSRVRRTICCLRGIGRSCLIGRRDRSRYSTDTLALTDH